MAQLAQTSIKLNARQREFVDRECARLDITISELIRRLLDNLSDEREEREARMAARARLEGTEGRNVMV